MVVAQRIKLRLKRLSEPNVSCCLGGYAAAVSLIVVVVFRGPSEANDPSIWAHELTHVDQYRDWGVHSFAVQYAKDYQSVEAPAYAKGNGYLAWAQQSGRDAGSPSLPSAYPAPAILPAYPAPPAVGAFCLTPIGTFVPGPIQPLGASCSIGTPNGPMFGRAESSRSSSRRPFQSVRPVYRELRDTRPGRGR